MAAGGRGSGRRRAAARRAAAVVCALALALFALPGSAPRAAAADRILTAAVLVNASVPAGYDTNPSTPGEFQRYPERYLEHLQVPYEIFDVSSTFAPADLADRQLIIVGHSGVDLPADWESAVTAAVAAGTGLVNLDWDAAVGDKQYVQDVFGATGSHAGDAASEVRVPQSVIPGGTAPHPIAAYQMRFAGDPPGDLVYPFHRDDTNVQRTSRATVLDGVAGTIVARLGTDPLILATSYGSGRAVHVGTLEYLKADRFGFVQGVDDLFWRSLVWAARKPFVLRGYPRFFAVQMDDTASGWGLRIGDLYDEAYTGPVEPDGTGGPWKVTGYLYTDNLVPGSAERASVVADIAAGKLKVAPHSFGNVTYGNLYWNAGSGPLSDTQWLANLGAVADWVAGDGGADTIPGLSRAMVPHFWDLSDNTGADLWDTLGYRYITSIQKPGFQNYADVNINGGSERLHARPFWLYELPPKLHRDESYSFFFADDYPVGSRSGLPDANLFLFTSQLQDPGFYPRADVIWPGASGFTVADSLEQFKRYAWHFWSGLSPVQIYTHDIFNYAEASAADRQALISQVSEWFRQEGARHLFMEDLGDAVIARTRSALVGAELTGTEVTYTFAGDAATADGALVDTAVTIFYDNASEGVFDTIAGFTGGDVVTRELPPPPPAVAGVSPGSGPVAGGTSVAITGANFESVAAVRFGSHEAGFVVNGPTSITADTPVGETGPVDVKVIGAYGIGTAPNAFTYLGPPRLDSIDPGIGPSQGGTIVTILGEGFEPSSGVWFGGTAAASVTYVSPERLEVTTPTGVEGPAEVQVGNSYGLSALPQGFYYFPNSGLARFDFTYASRSALLADGWDFLARTASGASRNTEQTGADAVSYDQGAHPGTVVLPANPGSIWESLNNSQNTLFFTLPAGWRSIRVGVSAFSPDSDYQQVSLMAYGNDDNYVGVNRLYDSGLGIPQTMEFARESNGAYLVQDRQSPPAGTAIHLRLDRDPATDSCSGFFSDDGATWTAMTGSVTCQLAAPRLAIMTGDNQSESSGPPASVAYAEIISVTAAPTVSGLSPTTGPEYGGTVVVINGSDFDSGTTVTIGGAAATSLVVSSTSSITAVVPAGTVGAADVTVTNDNGSDTLVAGFTYEDASSVLLQDDFNDGDADGWTISPLGYGDGWSVTDGAYLFDGSGHTQSWIGSSVWGDYSFEVQFRLFSLDNFPGGVRFRLDSGTGAGYALWLYPADSQIKLLRATGWDIDSPGLALLQTASGVSFEAGVFHNLRVDLTGSTIEVLYDGASVISVTDAAYAAGAIALDVSNRAIAFDNVLVHSAGGAGNPVPALTSISPSAVTAGAAGFTLTVNGSDFVPESVVRWDGSNRATTYVSATQLTATISAADVATPGSFPVRVLTPTPGGGTSGALNFTVNSPPGPTVSGILPASGPMAGGTAVAITGTGFIGGSTVTIGGVSATSVVVNDPTSISAVTPAGLAGSHDVTVANANGSGTLAAGYTYLAPVPTLSLISPDTVVAGGGDFSLTATGLGFVPASVVRWNGAERTTVFVSSTELTATITAADIAGAGTASVTVFTPAPGGGESGALTCTVNSGPPPAVSGISPAGGPMTGGTAVTISGSGFVGGSTVTIGGEAATSVVVASATSITAVTPSGAQGAADVVVTNANGSGTLAGGYAYQAPAPLLTHLFPATAVAGGSGLALTAKGTGFVPGSVVLWNGAERPTSYYSPTLLTATLSAADTAAAGTESVSVRTPAPGGGTSFRSVFFFLTNPAPVLTSLSPASAVVGSGPFTLTVNGSGFASGSVVRWNGTDRTTTHVSATQLTADIAAADVAAAGTAAVTVYTPAPGGGGSASLIFAIGSPGGAVVVSGVSPASGPTAGGTAVTITGSGFLGDSTVTIGGAAATGVVVSDATSLTAVTPAGTAGLADVTVSNGDGNGTLGGGYTYLAPVPLPTSLSPATAEVGAVGFDLTVGGSGFVPGSVVRWNGSDRATTYVSATELTAAIDAADVAVVGSPAVSVFNPAPGGGLSRRSLYFAVVNPAPELSALTPDSAVTGGAGFTLTVDGTGFVTGSVVRWDGADRTTTYVSPTRLTAAITAADIAALATVPVTVFTSAPGGGTSGSLDFSVVPPPPTVNGISPTSGPEAGGTSVTVTGTGFVAGSTVTIAGAAATSVVVNGPTSISAVTPAGTAGAADVTVTNANGSGTLAGGFTYLAPGTVLLQDDFEDGNADGWTISPLDHAAGWSVAGGAYAFDGSGHTQAWRGDAGWSDYELSVDVRLGTLDNYPGGIRGRVNPATGASYAVWIRPSDDQFVGPAGIELWRTAGWSIDTEGGAVLDSATGITFEAGVFHSVGLQFSGTTITVTYDGSPVISVTDATLASGAVALDVSSQAVSFDNVLVQTAGGGAAPIVMAADAASAASGAALRGTRKTSHRPERPSRR